MAGSPVQESIFLDIIGFVLGADGVVGAEPALLQSPVEVVFNASTDFD